MRSIASMLALVTLPTLTLVACATSQPAPAPQPPPSAVTSAAAPTLPAAPEAAPSAPAASPPASAAAPTGNGGAEVDAKYRACTAAADCVAVEPVGCCHTGRMIAVATAQKAAYLASFVCTDRRPICPMIRYAPDGRVPGCDQHLCILQAP